MSSFPKFTNKKAINTRKGSSEKNEVGRRGDH
jgi:hypothetical protein